MAEIGAEGRQAGRLGRPGLGPAPNLGETERRAWRGLAIGSRGGPGLARAMGGRRAGLTAGVRRAGQLERQASALARADRAVERERL
jgi:hypothetical protein